MSALKRSQAQETSAAAKPKRETAVDRRQTSLLFPVSGRKEKETAPRAPVPRRRKARPDQVIADPRGRTIYYPWSKTP